ncbi:hypothetical protein [Carnobacterium maltaromaticum]|uniref:hypothetical protein n=1 Tax=Carnobacterium maltaromaticum TaxID=2751 RepID=UPI00192E2DA7|nr:hypothetical protein [Carnobacterium maltaromaticum]
MKLVAVETINKDVYDFDRYDFEVKSPLSSKEYSVTTDFQNSEIRGEYIAYGEWNNLDIEECLEILDTLTEKEMKRDFSSIKKIILKKKHEEILEYKRTIYCEKYGVLDTKVNGKYMTYYASYLQSRETYKVIVDLDSGEETRKKLKGYYKKGEINMYL